MSSLRSSNQWQVDVWLQGLQNQELNHVNI